MRRGPSEADRRRQAAAERRRQRKPNKLSYKDQRELDRLPAEIESIEATVAELQQTIADPNFYAGDRQAIQSTLKQLADAETALERHMDRWSELEQLQESFRS